MKTARPKGAKGKADRLFSQFIRSRGFCEYGKYIVRGPEHCAGIHQCAHVISRRFSATRTDELNAWCLCSGHHIQVDEHAGLKMELVAATIGDDTYWRLYHKAHSFSGRMDWATEVERLASLLEEAA